MGYQITIEIEPGSAEDDVLKRVPDAREYVHGLLRTEALKHFADFVETDPVFGWSRGLTDKQLVEIQTSAKPTADIA